MTRYEILTLDLLHAKEKALEAAANVPDDGSCNHDSVFIGLPHWRKEATLKAIGAAGLSAFKFRRFGTPGFLVSPPGVGQASKNAVAMEAMRDYLAGKGYDVSGWYQID